MAFVVVSVENSAEGAKNQRRQRTDFALWKTPFRQNARAIASLIRERGLLVPQPPRAIRVATS